MSPFDRSVALTVAVIIRKCPVFDRGEALCVVNMVVCRRMTRDDPPFACIREFYFDHYTWMLRDVKLIEPFSVMGQLRLFDVPDRLIKFSKVVSHG